MTDSEKLLAWYDEHGRSLPWRKTQDPYAVLVSEAMLQQTRVASALGHYERWMRQFPTVQSLAEASEDQVLAVWQGLGYYRRAHSLLKAAQMVRETGWPNGERNWRDLPGVGEYTAAAMASRIHGECAPSVDGNVERVYARVRGDASSGATLRANARSWARGVMDSRRPGDSNQALMELGALVCMPRSPRCPECPFQEQCKSREGGWRTLPVRPPKPEVIESDLEIWIPVRNGQWGTAPLSGRWWKGMRGWPAVRPDGILLLELAPLRHTVTRHRLTFHAGVIEATDAGDLGWCREEEMGEIALPAPHRKLFAQALARLSAPA